MAANALIQTRSHAEPKERAIAVLDKIDLTVSDVMRIVLTRAVREGALPTGFVVDAAAHDAWFQAEVQEALNDPRPAVPQEKVEAHFAKRRAAALLKAGEGKA